jgi:hypothetical protein
MTTERYVVLGLAHVRSGWFREVGRWASSAMAPIDYLKCVSAEEVRARLATGRAFSALVADGSLHGVDRDLFDAARDAGCAVIVVDDGIRQRDWSDLGASAAVADGFTRTELVDLLHQHSSPIGQVDRLPGSTLGEDHASQWQGHLIGVTGPGGAGSSTLAMALAQGLAVDPRRRNLVALADLCLDADLAMMHNAQDVIPGVQELVDAHRVGTPTLEEIRWLTFDGDARGYRLLLGLRHHRDWTVIRVRAFEAAVASLRRCHRVVVADIDDDLEGESETGSADVEDRNLMARTIVSQADLVLAVGVPGLTGLHHLVRSCGRLLAAGVEPERLVPVINRSPRNSRARSTITSTFAELVGADRLAHNPVHVADRRGVDETLVDGVPLPAALAESIARPTQVIIESVGAGRLVDTPEPTPIQPGSLGHWTNEEAG